MKPSSSVNTATSRRTPLGLGRRRQRGAALWVITMLALVLGLIASSQISTVTSMFHAARDGRDLALARQAAESALRDAEADVICQQWTGSAWEQALSPTTPNSYCTSLLPLCTQLMPTQDAPGIRVLGSHPSTAPASINWDLPVGSCLNGNCAIELGSKTGAPALAVVAKQPRYQIDAFDVSPVGGSEPQPLFRITARGYGGKDTTVAELQEVYRPCR